MNRRAFLTALGAVATSRKFAPRAIQQFAEQTTVTVTRFPYLQNVTNARASILWAALDFGVGQVRFSADGINYQTVNASPRPFSSSETGLPYDYVQYQADLTGLSANTNYIYTVNLNGQDLISAGDARFRTAGASQFKFVVLGDSGWGDPNSDAQGLIAKQIVTEKPALVLHTGDLVYNPTANFDSYQRNYFNYYAATMCTAPFFPCPGNHEYDVPNAIPYLSIHSLPTDNVPAPDRGRYYSFDWGNVHFVSIDSMQALNQAVNSNGLMFRWLENDLRSTRQFWRIVYFHHPPYAGAGSNTGDIQSQWARAYMVPIFEKYGVQLVFSGHEHSYQRSQPIWKNNFVTSNFGITYLTSGGGGAALYSSPGDGAPSVPLVAFAKSTYHYLRVDVNGPNILVRSLRKDGTEVENFTIQPTPAFSENPKIVPVTMTPGPAAGATIRIYGRNLAAQESFSCTPTPPTEMVGTQVTVNGQPALLLYVSPTQIYAQIPFAVSGNITIKVITPNGSVDRSI
jgi:predicted MPP superfamily phosphohydrolase